VKRKTLPSSLVASRLTRSPTDKCMRVRPIVEPDNQGSESGGLGNSSGRFSLTALWGIPRPDALNYSDFSQAALLSGGRGDTWRCAPGMTALAIWFNFAARMPGKEPRTIAATSS